MNPSFWSRLRSLSSWRRKHSELDDEIQFHLSEEADEQVTGGLSPDEARAAARKDFGNPTLVRETLRETWTWSFAEHLGQDVRHGLRLMRRSPVFTTVAVLSLGLGIGANTAIFSVVDALLLKPLPVPHPEQLIGPAYYISDRQTLPFSTFNYADFVLWRDHLDGISGIAAVAETDRSNLQISGSATTESGAVHVALVSGTYFSVLGMGPQAGRELTAADDRIAGGHPVAVISDDYWRRRFQRAPGAIGQTFTLNATSYSIVGVMRTGFTGDWTGHPTDIWIPMAMQSEVMVEQPGLLTRHGPMWLRMVVRLKPETTPETAEERANVLVRSNDATVGNTMTFESLSHGYSQERRLLRAPAFIVLSLAAMVLLIACANVANLLLVRASARQAEMVVRVALGASRGRLVRQSLTESAVLAVLAGGVGLAAAAAGTSALGQLAGFGDVPLALDLHLDVRVLLFTAAISLTTALIFGMAPASASWRRSLTATTARVTGAPGRYRLASVLVIVQVALSMLLLIGAGLFIRTLMNLRTQDLGLDRGHVLLVKTAPEQAGLVGGAIADLMRRLPEQIAALPGVDSVAAASYAALGGIGSGTRCTVPGYTYAPDEDYFVRTNHVTPGYFESMGIRLAAGRDLTTGDNSRNARVAVINEAMSRYYWGTVNAVGRRFGLAGDTGNEIEVVGVVKDAQTEGLRDRQDRTVFLPYDQYAGRLRSLTLAVRAHGPIDNIREPVRSFLRTAAVGLPVVSLSTVDDNVDRILRTERLLATLSGLFGALALVLACLGLYGMLSYVTARRRNEIAVRMALGAGRREIQRLVLGASLALVLAGIAIGVTAAVFTMRVAASSLYGVRPTDISTICIAVGFMLVVASIATFVPARRAASVNPIVALRAE